MGGCSVFLMIFSLFLFLVTRVNNCIYVVIVSCPYAKEFKDRLWGKWHHKQNRLRKTWKQLASICSSMIHFRAPISHVKQNMIYNLYLVGAILLKEEKFFDETLALYYHKTIEKITEHLAIYLYYSIFEVWIFIFYALFKWTALPNTNTKKRKCESMLKCNSSISSSKPLQVFTDLQVILKAQF